MPKLIWDYVSGYVIDVETGEVIDRIYSYERYRNSRTEYDETWMNIKIRSTRRPRKLRRATITVYKRYEKAMKIQRSLRKSGRVYLELDVNMYVETGKQIKTIRDIRTTEIEKRLRNLGIYDDVMEVLNTLREKYPPALTRTRRNLLALCYIIYKMLRNEDIDKSFVTTVFDISETNYNRLRKLANRVLPYLK